MPAVEETLHEYLSELEMAQLKKCLMLKAHLCKDFPDLYQKMYDYYKTDMSYGTAKARTGDPYVFIIATARCQIRNELLDQQLKGDDDGPEGSVPE